MAFQVASDPAPHCPLPWSWLKVYPHPTSTPIPSFSPRKHWKPSAPRWPKGDFAKHFPWSHSPLSSQSLPFLPQLNTGATTVSNSSLRSNWGPHRTTNFHSLHGPLFHKTRLGLTFPGRRDGWRWRDVAAQGWAPAPACSHLLPPLRAWGWLGSASLPQNANAPWARGNQWCGGVSRRGIIWCLLLVKDQAGLSRKGSPGVALTPLLGNRVKGTGVLPIPTSPFPVVGHPALRLAFQAEKSYFYMLYSTVICEGPHQLPPGQSPWPGRVWKSPFSFNRDRKQGTGTPQASVKTTGDLDYLWDISWGPASSPPAAVTQTLPIP